MNEAQIISALHHNQPKAFEVLFEELFPLLCLYSAKITGDREEAKDIAAECLSKFWVLSKEQFASIDNIRRYLVTSAKHASLDFIRRSKMKERHHDSLAQITDITEDEADRMVLEMEILREIHAEIEALPERCREVFKMSYIDGLKRSEVAARLNISENTVRNQNVKALQILRVVFSEKELIVAYLVVLELHELGFHGIKAYYSA